LAGEKLLVTKNFPLAAILYFRSTSKDGQK